MAAEIQIKYVRRKRRDYGPVEKLSKFLCSDLGEFGDSTSLPTGEYRKRIRFISL